MVASTVEVKIRLNITDGGDVEKYDGIISYEKKLVVR
jgi:hypothetical protein